MMTRAIAVAAALIGGAGFSQLPEFSQQYMQRLGGAVDALGQVVADFDASAIAEGLTREAALSQMAGTAFVERRRADMVRTIDRHARLAADLGAMRTAGPVLRAWHVVHPAGAIARPTWRAFRPALPLTRDGAVFGGVGVLAGGLSAGGALSLLGRLAGRGRATA